MRLRRRPTPVGAGQRDAGYLLSAAWTGEPASRRNGIVSSRAATRTSRTPPEPSREPELREVAWIWTGRSRRMLRHGQHSPLSMVSQAGVNRRCATPRAHAAPAALRSISPVPEFMASCDGLAPISGWAAMGAPAACPAPSIVFGSVEFQAMVTPRWGATSSSYSHYVYLSCIPGPLM